MAEVSIRRSRVSRLGPGPRRGMVAAGLVMAVMGAMLPAWADLPQTGNDPSVTLTVAPADTVSDGQVVQITGTGFPPNVAGKVRQCAGSVAAPECDTFVAASFITTASGAIPSTPIAAQRIIHTITTTYNCSAQNCAMVADAGGKSSQHHISILGAGTSVPPTTVVPPPPPPSTIVPPPPPPPLSTTTSVPAAAPNLLCAILGAVSSLLGGLLDGLLVGLGCPPPG